MILLTRQNLMILAWFLNFAPTLPITSSIFLGGIYDLTEDLITIRELWSTLQSQSRRPRITSFYVVIDSNIYHYDIIHHTIQCVCTSSHVLSSEFMNFIPTLGKELLPDDMHSWTILENVSPVPHIGSNYITPEWMILFFEIFHALQLWKRDSITTDYWMDALHVGFAQALFLSLTNIYPMAVIDFHLKPTSYRKYYKTKQLSPVMEQIDIHTRLLLWFSTPEEFHTRNRKSPLSFEPYPLLTLNETTKLKDTFVKYLQTYTPPIAIVPIPVMNLSQDSIFPCVSTLLHWILTLMPSLPGYPITNEKAFRLHEYINQKNNDFVILNIETDEVRTCTFFLQDLWSVPHVL